MSRSQRQWIETLENRVFLAADLVINEFMASNQGGLADKDGEYSDWIEIKNQGNSSINLAGWGLTDNTDLAQRWIFPSVTLGAGKYLVVFASEKNITAGNELHTNFKLGAAGEYLALVQPDLTVKHVFDPFPVQSQNISYGLAPDDQTEIYFLTPTPGASNQLITDVVTFSEPSRTFTGSLEVALSTTDTGAQIRYTLDGSVPTSSSPLYSGPLTLTNTTVVRAKVYKSGYASGAVKSAEYFELNDSVASFESNLPVVILDSFGEGFGGTNLTPIAAYVVDTDPVTGRASPLNGAVDFAGRGGMRYRGQSSQGFPKHQFALELWDEANKDQNASLLGMPADSDWVLYAPYSEKSLMQNALAYEWSNRMGQYAVRTRFVEVFLNTSAGSNVNYSSDYLGVYILMEKIKIGDDRVDIEPMSPQDNTGEAVTGGYIFKKDKNDGNEPTINTTRNSFLYVEPDSNDITQQQRDYLSAHLNEFEDVLYGSNFADPVNGYAKYIDIQSFIDHHIMVELAKNIDGYRISTYYHKDRNGKIVMSPVWDYNLSMGNANYNGGSSTSGWYYAGLNSGDYPWFPRLFADPNFQQAYVDRWQELRADKFSTARLMQDVDEYVGELSDHNGNYPVGPNPQEASNNPVVRNFKRWNILGVSVWPNAYWHSAWIDEVNALKSFITNRAAWMDSQFAPRPTITTTGGGTGPTTVTITSSAAGQIYYTLDGSDPRAPGGGVAPGAILYTGPFQRTSTTRINARLFQSSSSRWSGRAVGLVQYDNGLRLTELNYHPHAPAAGSPYVDDDFEYIELRNTSSAPIDLTGYTFTDGITYTFPSRTLGAGQYLLLVKNPAAFATRYPGVTVDGTYTGSLNNAGERLRLVSPIEAEMFDFGYHDGDGWPGRADGGGSSLELVDATWGVNLDTKRAWRSSTEYGGTPRAASAGPINSIVINEVLSNSDQQGLVDAIELYNPTGGAINIGGWYLTDSQDNYKKFRIPTDTILSAGQYLVFDEGDFNPTPATPAPNHFQLNGAVGDDVWLVKADSSGNLQQFVDSVHFDAALPNESYGRLPNGTGKLLPMMTRSLGSVNTGAVRYGPVIISEVMYNPLGGNSDLEFIELFNTSGAAIDISGWKLEGAVAFTFAAGTTIDAHGSLVLVRFALTPANSAKLAEFRSHYGLALGVTVKLAGGYTGQLDNAGDNIQLLRPDVPPPTDPTITPYVPIDEVEYGPTSPWPGANGTGKSMSRLRETTFANDPSNWTAETASPGVGQMANAYAGGFAGDDRWTLKLNPAGTMLELYSSTALANKPILTRALGTIQTLTLTGLGGNDQVTIDYAYGNPLPPGGLVFEGGAGNDTLIVLATNAGTPAPRNVTFNGGTGANGAVLHGGTTNLVATHEGSMSLSADASARVTLGQTIGLSLLTISDNALLTLAQSGSHILMTEALSIGTNGRLDLKDNQMVVQASDSSALMTQVANWIRQGRNGGAWNGPLGIITTIGQRGAGLAMALNGGDSGNLFNAWGPFALNADSILVRHTYDGDADLNGVIDGGDFFLIDSGFMNQGQTQWYETGDFNYDGNVNIADYLMIDRSYARQGSPLAAPAATPAPEPISDPAMVNVFAPTGQVAQETSLFDAEVEDESSDESADDFDSASSQVL